MPQPRDFEKRRANSDWTLRLPRRCPYSGPVIVLGILSFLVLIATLVLLLVSYSSLPEQVPTHFGWDGAPNDYGPKRHIWMLYAVDVFLWLSLVVAGHFPRTWNIPVRIHEYNQWQVCNATRIFLYVLNFFVILLLGAIFLAIIFSWHTSWLMFTFLAGMTLTIPIYVLVVRRFNR